LEGKEGKTGRKEWMRNEEARKYGDEKWYIDGNG